MSKTGKEAITRGTSALAEPIRDCLTLDQAMAMQRQIDGDRAALERYRSLVAAGCLALQTAKDYAARAVVCDQIITRKESDLKRLLARKRR